MSFQDEIKSIRNIPEIRTEKDIVRDVEIAVKELVKLYVEKCFINRTEPFSCYIYLIGAAPHQSSDDFLICERGYDEMSGSYEQEQMELRQELESLAIKIQEIDMQEKCIKEFIEQAKAYVNPTELTPEMLRVFIRRIEVYEKAEKYSRTCGNPIAIYFTFQPKINTTPITLFMDVAEEECETAISA